MPTVAWRSLKYNSASLKNKMQGISGRVTNKPELLTTPSSYCFLGHLASFEELGSLQRAWRYWEMANIPSASMKTFHHLRHLFFMNWQKNANWHQKIITRTLQLKSIQTSPKEQEVERDQRNGTNRIFIQLWIKGLAARQARSTGVS